MRRILLTIEYDGSEYFGFQLQNDKNTIQSEIEKALFLLCGNEIRITGGSRTDRGVHAYGQTAHFDTDFNIKPAKFREALNRFLPSDIRIIESREVDAGFHSRFDARRKTYRYQMYIADVNRPLDDKYRLRLPHNINVEAMIAACNDFTGTHDFKAFSNTNDWAKTTVRTIHNAKLITDGRLLTFEVCGNAFLYNMVRIMCGTLVYIGRGTLPPDTVKTALETKDRKKAGKTLDAKALFLVNIEY